jgi:hypothetical protein
MAKAGNIVDNSIYQAALEGLELQKQRIDDQIKQVRALLTGTRKTNKAAPAPASVKAGAPKKRRKLGASAKKRISEAQKKRWAAFREKQEGEKS